MEQKLFRKESLDRVSSPEQLNQYIRVSNPSVWLILSAVIVLLVAACVWGFTGRMETTLDVKAIVKDGQAVCLLNENERTRIKVGTTFRVGEQPGEVSQIPAEPMSYESLYSTFGEYALYASDISKGEWRYALQGALPLADGVYDAQIVIDSVSPISFLLN